MLLTASALPAGQDTGLPAGIKASSERFQTRVAEHREEELRDAVEYFQELAEWAFTLRARTRAFSVAVESRGDEQALTAAELELLRSGTLEHLALRDEVLALIGSFGSWDDPTTTVPNEDQRLKGVMLSLAGALVLYDNFAYAVILVHENTRLRRIANRADLSFNLSADELFDSARRYHAEADRERTRRALDLVESSRARAVKLGQADPQFAYLQSVIDASAFRERLKDDSLLDRVLASLQGAQMASGDVLDSLRVESTQDLIGRLIGDGGEPTPHLGQLKPTPLLLASLESELEPLDVLLDKSRWRSFDKLIPGYFTHVAVWVGNERQLRELGLWDHPAVRSHHAEILAGKRILEAVRSGVRLNDLETFLNLDDLALLRPRSLSVEDRVLSLQRSFVQIGKQYDFNFDIETTDRLVCSEVPYAVFRNIRWPTQDLLGRTTISPDNVAIQALDDGAFELYRLFIEGAEVDENRQAAFRSLLEE